MKWNLFISIGLLSSLLGLGACCEPCDTTDLGSFSLNQGSNEWIEYATTTPRLFQSSMGREITFSYSSQQSGLEDQVENCNSVDNCGACCEYSYNSAFIFTEFLSTNLEFNFDVSLRKDFLRNNVLQDPTTIDDYLSITFNNRISMELFSIPDTTSAVNATLNGKTFTRVFAYVEDAVVLDPNSKEPAAIYFTKDEGIVGFKLADGEEWSLEL